MAKGKGLLITGILGVLLLALSWYKLSPKNKSVEATEDAGASSGGGGGGGSGSGGSTQQSSTNADVLPSQPNTIITATKTPTLTVAPRPTVNPLIKTVSSVTKPATTLKITGSEKDDDFLTSIEHTL